MTNKIYKTEIFDREHRYSGGLIYPLDFNTNYRGKENPNGSSIAARIEADFHRAEKTGTERGVLPSANLVSKSKI